MVLLLVEGQKEPRLQHYRLCSLGSSTDQNPPFERKISPPSRLAFWVSTPHSQAPKRVA